MYISNYHRRIKAVFACFFLFFLFCIGRLGFIQLFHSEYLSGIAKRQQNLFLELEPRRGAIFDVNFKPQAINLAAESVFATPNEITDNQKESIVRQLAGLLNVNQEYLRERLSRKKYFIWLARKIDPDQAQRIKSLKLKGVDFVKETKRSYSNGYLASHILGFAGLDNVGLAGLELYYNKYLKGESGWALFLRDARQKKLDLQEKAVLPKDGYNVVLTMDEVVQYIAERELDKVFKSSRAQGASIVVMNPHTGEILALANRPNFDLNDYNLASADKMRNRAITDLFEPGSVFKIVAASAALEENKVSEEDKFFCENGSYKFGSHILHDNTSHGTLTFREVIEQSSNIGTAKVAQLLGPDLLYRYIKLFGFGTKTGIDMPGEINGLIREPRYWSKISIVTIPMGQEVGVTALQLASAVSVIANGGLLMRPFIVKEISDKYGEVIKEYSPQLVRKVISLDTAERVKKILKGVIDNGTGKLAKLPDFSAAGKTGTAQKLEPNGTYSHNKFIASFIGFAPVEDPQIVIAVVIDEPHPNYFGGVVAAPVFKIVASESLRYLNAKNFNGRADKNQ